VGAELFHAVRQADETNLIVPLCNCENAAKKRQESTSEGDTKCHFITYVILGHAVESAHCLCMSHLTDINRTDGPYKTAD